MLKILNGIVNFLGALIFIALFSVYSLEENVIYIISMKRVNHFNYFCNEEDQCISPNLPLEPIPIYADHLTKFDIYGVILSKSSLSPSNTPPIKFAFAKILLPSGSLCDEHKVTQAFTSYSIKYFDMIPLNLLPQNLLKNSSLDSLNNYIYPFKSSIDITLPAELREKRNSTYYLCIKQENVYSITSEINNNFSYASQLVSRKLKTQGLWVFSAPNPWFKLILLKAQSRYILPYLSLQIVLIILLFLISGLFSGLTIGLLSLDPTELMLIQKSGNPDERRYAKIIAPVRKRGNFLLCTLVLANVLVNSTLTILLENLSSGKVAVIVSTIGITLFGEILPQAICTRHGLAIGAHTVWLTKTFMVLTAPLSWPLSIILDRMLGQEIGSVYDRQRLIELVKMMAGGYHDYRRKGESSTSVDLKAHSSNTTINNNNFDEDKYRSGRKQDGDENLLRSKISMAVIPNGGSELKNTHGFLQQNSIAETFTSGPRVVGVDHRDTGTCGLTVEDLESRYSSPDSQTSFVTAKPPSFLFRPFRDLIYNTVGGKGGAKGLTSKRNKPLPPSKATTSSRDDSTFVKTTEDKVISVPADDFSSAKSSASPQFDVTFIPLTVGDDRNRVVSLSKPADGNAIFNKTDLQQTINTTPAPALPKKTISLTDVTANGSSSTLSKATTGAGRNIFYRQKGILSTTPRGQKPHAAVKGEHKQIKFRKKSSSKKDDEYVGTSTPKSSDLKKGASHKDSKSSKNQRNKSEGDIVTLRKDEADIITGALFMCTKTVSEIMTPLKNIFALGYTSILDFDTMASIVSSGYTRIPVFREPNKSNIVGVLNFKDLAFIDPDDKIPLATILKFYNHAVTYVFEDTLLSSILEEFKKGKSHMAFVRRIIVEDDKDPSYRMVGLVTLEDVIEEIIQSEIWDETDNFDRMDNKGRHIRKRERNFNMFWRPSSPLKGSYALSPQMALVAFQYLKANIEPFREELVSAPVLRKLIRRPSVVIHHGDNFWGDGLSSTPITDEPNKLLSPFSLPTSSADSAIPNLTSILKLPPLESIGNKMSITVERNDSKDAHKPLYEKGNPADYFILILEGRVRVYAGNENICFESGPFSYFGIQALLESMIDDEKNGLQQESSPQMIKHDGITEHSTNAKDDQSNIISLRERKKSKEKCRVFIPDYTVIPIYCKCQTTSHYPSQSMPGALDSLPCCSSSNENKLIYLKIRVDHYRAVRKATEIERKIHSNSHTTNAVNVVQDKSPEIRINDCAEACVRDEANNLKDYEENIVKEFLTISPNPSPVDSPRHSFNKNDKAR